MTAELDPLSELRFLTEALRAHAEWQQACGAASLPADSGEPSRAALPLHAPVVEQAEPSKLEPPPRAERAPLAASSAPAVIAAPAVATASLLTSEQRQHRLAVLADEARACTRCALHEERKQAVFSRGNGSSGLCFVGEGPGADEDDQGFPFVGPAGQLLDRMIGAMGIERDDVYVCNIVKCRPPKNRTPEPEEMSACMPYLTEQLSLI